MGHAGVRPALLGLLGWVRGLPPPTRTGGGGVARGPADGGNPSNSPLPGITPFGTISLARAARRRTSLRGHVGALENDKPPCVCLRPAVFFYIPTPPLHPYPP